jgi:hypothetical protein
VFIGFLPPDFSQFSGLQSGVFFQNPERIAALDGPVLGGVTGQNNSAVLFFGKIGHPRQRANAQKSGLINPNHLAANLCLQLLILQQRLDRFGIGKSGIRPQHATGRFCRRCRFALCNSAQIHAPEDMRKARYPFARPKAIPRTCNLQLPAKMPY